MKQPKTNYDDSLRMYGWCPYQLSGIQAGIQYGHAVNEYSKEHNDETYQKWSHDCITSIILNGGTHDSMLEISLYLDEIGWNHSLFFEPDMNNMLTGIAAIVPEQCYNKKLYFDMPEWLANLQLQGEFNQSFNPYTFNWNIANQTQMDLLGMYIDYLGGLKNYKMRKYLSNFKLAQN